MKSICGIRQCNDVVLSHLFVNKSCYIVECFVGVMLWSGARLSFELGAGPYIGSIVLFCTV